MRCSLLGSPLSGYWFGAVICNTLFDVQSFYFYVSVLVISTALQVQVCMNLSLIFLCFCQLDCSAPRTKAPSAPRCRTSPSLAGTLSRSEISNQESEIPSEGFPHSNCNLFILWSSGSFRGRILSDWLCFFLQTMNQLLEKMKQGEHVFDVNAEPEPEPEEDECPDFDADYEEGLEPEDRSKEHKEGCEASGSGRAR